MTFRTHIPARHLRYLCAALAVLVAFSSSLADAAHPKVQKENKRADSHQIESLEQDWLHALVRSDTATLDKLMSEDFLAISANGTLSDKSQYLLRVEKRVNAFTNIDVMDMKVRVQPASAVVISQVRVVGQLDGRKVNGIFRYTKVYERSAGGPWRVMNLEATRVSGMNPEGTDMHPGKPLDRRSLANR